MQWMKTMLVVMACLVTVAVASAGENISVANSHNITFSSSVRLGDVLLTPGEYNLKHVMDGNNHFMVFTKLSGKPASVRVKCSLVPLPEKAQRSARTYTVNAVNEQVLQELVFVGDSAKHVF